MNCTLLLIDPQNDFCSEKGTLYVPGAEDDCCHIAEFVSRNVSSIKDICVTLDCHPYFHIAHPCFWVDRDGKNVEPYTTISYKDFDSGKYTPSLISLKPRVDEYLMTLENMGRYQLTVWPPHCLVGTEGSAVFPAVWESINMWEKNNTGNSVNYIYKSRNPMTEHYSAVQAEVQDASDGSTRTNFSLIDRLKKSDRIIVAGEALSHCVANTLRDLFIYIPPKKFALLRDCTSSVKGYEKFSEDFVEELKSKGMEIIKSDFCL